MTTNSLTSPSMTNTPSTTPFGIASQRPAKATETTSLQSYLTEQKKKVDTHPADEKSMDPDLLLEKLLEDSYPELDMSSNHLRQKPTAVRTSLSNSKRLVDKSTTTTTMTMMTMVPEMASPSVANEDGIATNNGNMVPFVRHPRVRSMTHDGSVQDDISPSLSFSTPNNGPSDPGLLVQMALHLADNDPQTSETVSIVIPNMDQGRTNVETNPQGIAISTDATCEESSSPIHVVDSLKTFRRTQIMQQMPSEVMHRGEPDLGSSQEMSSSLGFAWPVPIVDPLLDHTHEAPPPPPSPSASMFSDYLGSQTSHVSDSTPSSSLEINPSPILKVSAYTNNSRTTGSTKSPLPITSSIATTTGSSGSRRDRTSNASARSSLDITAKAAATTKSLGKVSSSLPGANWVATGKKSPPKTVQSLVDEGQGGTDSIPSSKRDTDINNRRSCPGAFAASGGSPSTGIKEERIGLQLASPMDERVVPKPLRMSEVTSRPYIPGGGSPPKETRTDRPRSHRSTNDSSTALTTPPRHAIDDSPKSAYTTPTRFREIRRRDCDEDSSLSTSDHFSPGAIAVDRGESTIRSKGSLTTPPGYSMDGSRTGIRLDFQGGEATETTLENSEQASAPSIGIIHPHSSNLVRYEVVATSKEPTTSSRRRCRLWLLIAGLGVIIVCVAIVIPLTLKSHRNGSSSSNTTWMPPTTSSPDHNYPTASPNNVIRLKNLQAFLAPTSGMTALINTSTPQNKAVEWLAYRDPAGLDLDNTLASNLRERYIVAVLYFATNGDEWSKRLNFLSNFSVCDWNGSSFGR